jgi:alanine-synthesizing transaminase
MASPIQPARRIDDVHYDIRGPLARRAHALEQSGVEVLHLNIGNPSLFGLETPQVLREAVAAHLPHADGYGPQLGIMPAREAIAAHAQRQGFDGVTFNDVIIGNGVSELVDLSLRSLLEPGDEVLIPAPDYPLWSASVILNNARPVYYPCPAELGFEPDVGALEALITPNTRALVVINPNNPTGAVYSRDTLQQLADLADRHGLVLLADEIYAGICYDNTPMVPMATLAGGVCLSFGGLSKVHRACGLRVGWAVISGEKSATALEADASIADLIRPGGRLDASRRAIMQAVERSNHLSLVEPKGALYAFPAIRGLESRSGVGGAPYDDAAFARDLLETHHILVVPGSSFNLDQRAFFRATFLPEPAVLTQAFQVIDQLLDSTLHRQTFTATAGAPG